MTLEQILTIYAIFTIVRNWIKLSISFTFVDEEGTEFKVPLTRIAWINKERNRFVIIWKGNVYGGGYVPRNFVNERNRLWYVFLTFIFNI